MNEGVISGPGSPHSRSPHNGGTDATDLVRRHIEAFNAADADALLADFTENATWKTGDYAVPRGQIREFFTTAMSQLTPELRMRRVVADGAVVVAELTEIWTHDGRAKSADLVTVFDLRAGRIAAGRIYREGSADA